VSTGDSGRRLLVLSYEPLMTQLAGSLGTYDSWLSVVQ